MKAFFPTGFLPSLLISIMYCIIKAQHGIHFTHLNQSIASQTDGTVLQLIGGGQRESDEARIEHQAGQ